MTKWWWNDPKWEQLQFKRVPQGWIYGSPIRWSPFGISPHSHFLLSDVQKDEVTKVFGRWSWHLMAVMCLVFVPGFCLLWIFRDVWVTARPSALIAFVLYGVCAQYVLNVYYWLILRRPLADAQPTSERITFGERFNTTAQILPRGFLIFYAAFFALLILLFGYVPIKTKTWDLLSLALPFSSPCSRRSGARNRISRPPETPILSSTPAAPSRHPSSCAA